MSHLGIVHSILCHFPNLLPHLYSNTWVKWWVTKLQLEFSMQSSCTWGNDRKTRLFWHCSAKGTVFWRWEKSNMFWIQSIRPLALHLNILGQHLLSVFQLLAQWLKFKLDANYYRNLEKNAKWKTIWRLLRETPWKFWKSAPTC